MFGFLKRLASPSTEYRVIYRNNDADFYLSTLVKARSQYDANRIFDQDPRYMYCVRILTTEAN